MEYSEFMVGPLIYHDIKSRIEHDFGHAKVLDVLAKFDEFAHRFEKIYHEKVSARIIRCVIKISEGDMDLLDRYIRSALLDWRDVILWAEYDKDGRTRIFSGNQSFA
jgi:hypothetical protein